MNQNKKQSSYFAHENDIDANDIDAKEAVNYFVELLSPSRILGRHMGF